MARTYLAMSALLVCAIAAQLGGLWWANRIQERAVAAAFKPIDHQLDDLNRRACNVYRDLVAKGRMKSGDPAFSDCSGAR